MITEAVLGDRYRFGFNGQERETSINESVTSAPYWMYDGRLGRRWNVDPVVKYDQSGYSTFANNPIWFVDHNGADTMLISSQTDKPIENLMRKGGQDLIFMSGEDGTWKGAVQLFYEISKISGQKGGTPSEKGQPVKWRWTDKNGKTHYLQNQTDRFDDLLEKWIPFFTEKNTQYDKIYGAGNQVSRMPYFQSMVTDFAPVDIKQISSPISFHPAVIGEWSWYNGQLLRYDDYGNVLYGNVGAAFGLKSTTLLGGAHANQIWKNIKGLIGEGTNGIVDDSRDTDMIKKGINMYYNGKGKK